MTPSLTICYVTSREKPCINWFFDSLLRSIRTAQYPPFPIQIVVVDLLKDSRPENFIPDWAKDITVHSEIKPTVWQGKHRVTKENWWAASSSRNVGMILARGEWIAYCDDRCVLMPEWMPSVVEAMRGNYVVFGSYQKRKEMKVENGVIVHGGIVTGEDSREAYVIKNFGGAAPWKCGGEWGFGCTLAFPLEWGLQVNGYPEEADSVSMEDILFTMCMSNSGYETRYDRRMKIIEDRTPSELGAPMIRKDAGESPRDKSHMLLDMLKDKKAATHPINLRQIRADVLSGKPFPAPWGPTHCFFTGKPITEL